MNKRAPSSPAPISNAILVLVFNRPDLTAQLFQVLRRTRPPRLYIASDGPRLGVAGEKELVAETQAIFQKIDWPCEVKVNYQTENLGCKLAVSSAMNWFFRHETQGIILEDDCLPSESFFPFCDALLDRYAVDERVKMITGNNFQGGRKIGDGSYYFSRYPHIWGWATWRRAWHSYDGSLSFWPAWSKSHAWESFFASKIERHYWEKIFNSSHAGLIDSWAYPWTASVWHSGGLIATPNENLVSNHGFRNDGTHTRHQDSRVSFLPTGQISSLVHPEVFTASLEADSWVFESIFRPKASKFPFSLLSDIQIALLKRLRHLVGRAFQRFVRS